MTYTDPRLTVAVQDCAELCMYLDLRWLPWSWTLRKKAQAEGWHSKDTQIPTRPGRARRPILQGLGGGFYTSGGDSQTVGVGEKRPISATVQQSHLPMETILFHGVERGLSLADGRFRTWG